MCERDFAQSVVQIRKWHSYPRWSGISKRTLGWNLGALLHCLLVPSAERNVRATTVTAPSACDPQFTLIKLFSWSNSEALCELLEVQFEHEH